MTQSYYITQDKLTGRWNVSCKIIKGEEMTLLVVGAYATERGAKWVRTRLTKLFGK